MLSNHDGLQSTGLLILLKHQKPLIRITVCKQTDDAGNFTTQVPWKLEITVTKLESVPSQRRTFKLKYLNCLFTQKFVWRQALV